MQRIVKDDHILVASGAIADVREWRLRVESASSMRRWQRLNASQKPTWRAAEGVQRCRAFVDL